MIAIAAFKTITDSIAKQYQVLDAVFGTGVEGNSASLGAQNNLDRVLALNVYETENALLAGAKATLDNVLTIPNISMFYEKQIRDLNYHVSGINSYLTTNASRIAPECREIIIYTLGITLSALNVFSLAITVNPGLGIFTQTGAGAGIFIPGTGYGIGILDITKYAPQQLTCHLQTHWTVAADLNFTCKKLDGTLEIKSIHIPVSTAGTEINIGISSDKYYQCTAATCTGGQAGQICYVVVNRERAAVL